MHARLCVRIFHWNTHQFVVGNAHGPVWAYWQFGQLAAREPTASTTATAVAFALRLAFSRQQHQQAQGGLVLSVVATVAPRRRNALKVQRAVQPGV
jgi:hypothetical protein